MFLSGWNWKTKKIMIPSRFPGLTDQGKQRQKKKKKKKERKKKDTDRTQTKLNAPQYNATPIINNSR